VDFDTMSPERLDDFRYAITTTAGFQSQPPPNMTMVDTVGSYELWKRKGRTPPQRVLDEGSSPGVKLDCNTPAASDLSIQDGSATVLPEPVVGDLTSWSRSSPFGAPGSASQKLVLRPGHWQLSLQYASQVSLDVTGPHLQKALPPSLDGMYFTHPGEGEFWDAGALTVKRRGPVTITVSASQPPLFSRLAGAHRRVWLGTLAATRVAATHTLPLKQSCGQYVDHYTLNAAER
jgi:hypothetical protein